MVHNSHNIDATTITWFRMIVSPFLKVLIPRACYLGDGHNDPSCAHVSFVDSHKFSNDTAYNFEDSHRDASRGQVQCAYDRKFVVHPASKLMTATKIRVAQTRFA